MAREDTPKQLARTTEGAEEGACHIFFLNFTYVTLQRLEVLIYFYFQLYAYNNKVKNWEAVGE